MYVNCVMSDLKLQTTSCADRMFNIRRSALQMYPTFHGGASDGEYSTFDGDQYRIENRIFLHTSRLNTSVLAQKRVP